MKQCDLSSSKKSVGADSLKQENEILKGKIRALESIHSQKQGALEIDNIIRQKQ